MCLVGDGFGVGVLFIVLVCDCIESGGLMVLEVELVLFVLLIIVLWCVGVGLEVYEVIVGLVCMMVCEFCFLVGLCYVIVEEVECNMEVV